MRYLFEKTNVHVLRCMAITLALFVILIGGPAFAQDPTETPSFVVNYWPIIEWALGIVGTVAIAMGGVAVRAIAKAAKDRVGIEIDDATRAMVLNAIEGGVDIGIAKAKDIARDKGLGSYATQNAILATAANYAVAQVPDGLKRLGIDEDGAARIAQRFLAARLGVDDGLAEAAEAPAS